MDTPAELTLPRPETPPARKGRRRFGVHRKLERPARLPLRKRLPSAIPAFGGMTLLMSYLSLIVLIPIAALAAHGIGFSIDTHGDGGRVCDWLSTGRTARC